MITRWAIKGLLLARTRVIGSTLAVGAAFALVIMFRAVWEGETRQLAAYLENAGADVWVMQSSVSNMHMATSFVTEGKRNEVANIEGVESLSGILYLNTLVEAGGAQWFSYVVGVDEPHQMGGPWSVPQGRDRIEPGEAVFPLTLARLTKTTIGDEIQIADLRLTIVGLSEGTFSATNPVTFVHARDIADLLSLTGYDSYLLVRAEPGVAPAELAARIRAEVDGVQTLPTDELVQSDLQLARQMGTEVIALMTGICAILATLLVGFALFIHASHARRELATLKALGFPSRHVYGTVLLQAAVLAGLAFGLAVGLVGLVALVGPSVAPILSLRLTAESLVSIGLAGLAVAATATLALARWVARVDPMTVFSS